MMNSKIFIDANALKYDSLLLASKVVNSGFKPDYLVAIWRGGAVIGCYVHGFLRRKGIKSDHIAIRTSRYTGVDQTKPVEVHNLGYLCERLTAESTVLLVDDVLDSGLSIQAVFEALQEKLGDRMPKDIRVATIYYKPTRNETSRVPDYKVHNTDDWLVFPHELEDMTLEEVEEHYGADTAKLL